MFLESEIIGIIPPHGYRPEDKQSIKVMKWLKFIASTEGLRIQHAANDGEKHIGSYKVDGYITNEGEKDTILEFHGCFWHGCTKCYARNTINTVTDCTMADPHMRTLDKQRYLQHLGYNYRCMWECDFERQSKLDKPLKSFLNTLDIEDPLEPRDAFYGGRTEAFMMYAEASEDQQIKYYDVTSLYPYNNKVGKVPLGHPKTITKNFDNIEEYEGLILCKMLPPRDLFISVLPFRTTGK
ncbi:uncharacterized protein LOC110445345 [Mizuhopecten yessoensis]|uniref:uncharacterized protein LOC110445345 n=1 Tax=Mizuhopecten yessoensis TaxID=6573 RepID=UPI000B4572F1|nr:uncharacterized protein LOC110445345 [Mizuhopecten yessoensis]